MKDLADIRQDYLNAKLIKSELALDPMVQFERWYLDAEKSEIEEPNAMTLSTVSADGKPSSRIVLLKGFNRNGFIFYTNYESRKGKEIENNPWVSIVFWFKELHRQVRIEGITQKVDYDTSLGYFHSRPRGSQVSAWASPQSQVVDEHVFEENRKNIEARFKDLDHLPLPEFWGGYLIKPTILEFWQGRSNRYHDRFKYHLSDDGHWYIDRLAP